MNKLEMLSILTMRKEHKAYLDAAGMVIHLLKYGNEQNEKEIEHFQKEMARANGMFESFCSALVDTNM